MNLQECGAVDGDTVLCTHSRRNDVYQVDKEYLVSKYKGYLRLVGDKGPHLGGYLGHFVVVKPASGWIPCTVGSALQRVSDKHEFSYHNGVATHYRVVTPLVEVVEQRVKFRADYPDGPFAAVTTIHLDYSNATLKGETHDGKPVGVWNITMDEE